MSIYDKGSMKTAADVVALMQSMLTPESFERWRALFPDSRIEEFIEEYLDYDQARGWEDEVFDDPDQQQYVMSEEYWEENFGNDPTYATTTRYVNNVRHGDSDSKFTVGYPEPYEPSEEDLEPEELAARYGEDPAYWRHTKGGKLNSSKLREICEEYIGDDSAAIHDILDALDDFGYTESVFKKLLDVYGYSGFDADAVKEKMDNRSWDETEAHEFLTNLLQVVEDLGYADKVFSNIMFGEGNSYCKEHNIGYYAERNSNLNSSLNCAAVQNAHVEQTPQGTWVVRGDSERFGKNAILYEDYKKQRAVSYLHKLNKSESAKNMARSRYKADLNSETNAKGNMRVRASVNCARHQHAITCLNCAVSEVTVPTDFVRTESRAFDLMMIVQNELWDKGMDVTIKQLYRPKSDTFRFSYIITDATTTDEQVDAAIEEIVGKLVQSGFIPAEAYGDLGLVSSEGGKETTDIFINVFEKFPSMKLWECMNWLEHEMWAEGWDASIESADQPKPDQIALTVSHPSSISDEDIDDFIKDRVLEFIENGYERFVYPETDPRSRYNASLSCSVDWVSGDGNAFYLVDDGEDDGWGDTDEYEDYKVETDEYGNDVVHYEGYVITGNERIGYVALSPYGTWSPTIYRSITDAVDDVDRDIATKSQARA